MNMHVPQSIQTATELRYLAPVARHIISPSKNEPIIAPAQDTLLGMFKLTDDATYFTQAEAMNLMTTVEAFKGIFPEPAIKEGNKTLWSGKQLYSIILPPINLTNNLSEPLKNVIIENGILKQGQIESKTSKKIVHIIYNDYGFQEAARYLNDLQRIVSRFMIRSGYSVGISDLIIHPEIRKRNQERVVKAKNEVMDLTRRVHLNILEDLSQDLNKIYEDKVSAVGSGVSKGIMDDTTKNLSLANRINYIVKSGSKGDGVNIQQMMCLLGQQIIDGKKVPLGYIDRSLPHYPRYENGMESRGFITSNFLEGLSPQEFFFHAMSGREGLIDTAVKTANSGYLQRKLVKATEDLKVAHDSTVRSSTNDIVEFCYGDDGFNSASLEKQSTNFLKITAEKKEANYYLLESDKWDEFMTAEAIRKMKKVSGWKDKLNNFNRMIDDLSDQVHQKFIKFVSKIDDIGLYYPVNFKRLIDNTITKFAISKSAKTDLNPINIIDGINNLMQECKIGVKENLSFKILVHDYLSPKILLRDKRITPIAFDYIMQVIKAKFNNAIAEGGEMVGPLAATSIGEISTQMTLNTFHLAGVGEKSSVTAGVPRLHELLSNTKNPKTPTCRIYLTPNLRYDKDLCNKIRNNLELTKISDILLSSAIYLEPSNDTSNVNPEDRDIMEIYKVFNELNAQATQIPKNPWVIRLEFDRHKILDQRITMADIHHILVQNYPTANLMYHDINAAKLIFRIRIDMESKPDNIDDDIIYLKSIIHDIGQIVIKGVDEITKVWSPMDTNIYVKENNSWIEKQEYRLETDGSNLFDIIIREGVDSTRTYSMDPNEMNSVFGIEAAKFMIEDQLRSLLEASSAMTNQRHFALLCDKMCRKGEVMSVDRHGINRENIGPLAKCSFEETSDQLREASIFGAYDDIKGVSSNIMVGQIPNCGTGESEILLDEDMLMEIQEKYSKLRSQLTDLDTEDKVDWDEIMKVDPTCNEMANIKFTLSNVETESMDFDALPTINFM